MPDTMQPEAVGAADIIAKLIGDPEESQAQPAKDEIEPEAASQESHKELGEPAEADTEEPTEDEPDESDTEDAADEFEEEVPQLDPLLAELAKGNPKAERRLAEINRGIEHVKNLNKKLKSDLELAKPKVEFLDGYDRALYSMGKDPAAGTLKALAAHVAAHHNTTIEALLGLQTEAQSKPEVDEFGRPVPEHERRGYSSAREMEMDREIQGLKSVVAGFQQSQQQAHQEREEAKKQAEFKSLVDKVAPPTIKRLAATENGWKVSKQMVEKAITEFPQFRDNPVRAVKAAFPDDLKQHYARLTAQTRTRRGPEMLPQSRAVGEKAIDPTRVKAADIIARLTAEEAEGMGP